MKMSVIPSNIRDILSFKIKHRYDGVTDQFSRIFMPKLFILLSVIMSINFFNDKVHCIIPVGKPISKDFVHATCWITGFYVYEDMHEKLDESAYYGIPETLDYDGLDENGHLCSMNDRTKRRRYVCKPMKKRYFLQYQWMPFYVASLALMYYLPYILFQIINADIISLNDSIQEARPNVDILANNYFNYKVNSKLSMRLRIIANVLIKKLYVVVNMVGFMVTDRVLEGRYLKYGLEWCSWHILPNYKAHDLTKRNNPKPGNYILPSWGLCDLHEALRDVVTTSVNRHRFICEVSPNVVYQYALIIMWFFFNIGIFLSTLGLIMHLVNHIKTIFCVFKPGFKEGTLVGEMYVLLTFREIEYLEYVKHRNIPIYGELMRKLTKSRPDMFSLKRFFDNELSRISLL